MRDKKRTKAYDPINPVLIDTLISDRSGNFDNVGSINPYGLTKREYFAGLALQGLVINNANTDKKIVVKHCVQFADELIQELNNIENNINQ